jgi:hypothetical protein
LWLFWYCDVIKSSPLQCQCESWGKHLYGELFPCSSSWRSWNRHWPKCVFSCKSANKAQFRNNPPHVQVSCQNALSWFKWHFHPTGQVVASSPLVFMNKFLNTYYIFISFAHGQTISILNCHCSFLFCLGSQLNIIVCLGISSSKATSNPHKILYQFYIVWSKN